MVFFNVVELVSDAFGGVLSFGDIIRQFLLSIGFIIPVELVPVISILAAVVIVIIVMKFASLVLSFL